MRVIKSPVLARLKNRRGRCIRCRNSRTRKSLAARIATHDNKYVLRYESRLRRNIEAGMKQITSSSRALDAFPAGRNQSASSSRYRFKDDGMRVAAPLTLWLALGFAI